MGGTLLLADDSITIQKVVELTFADTGHRVVAVGGGDELLQRVAEVKPDVVLCDVVMPDVNGYDVCQQLKSDPVTLHIPVVLLTGTFEPFDRNRALAAGCDAIVTKPFEARDLIATVEELLERGRAFHAVQPPDEAAPHGIGVPDGVQGLDFTTSGFDKMVPPPPLVPQMPTEGIELTESFLGQSRAPARPTPPPELRAPAVAAPFSPVPAAAFTEAQPVPTVTQKISTAFLHEPAPPMAESAFVEPSAPVVDVPAFDAVPVAETGAETVMRPVFASAPHAAVSVTEPPPAPRGASATPAEPEPAIAAAAVEQVAAPPEPAPVEPPPAAVAPAPSEASASIPIGVVAGTLSNDDVERIARKVVELAAPLLERIAWEMIPDMAEMVVRQRIQELETAAEEQN